MYTRRPVSDADSSPETPGSPLLVSTALMPLRRAAFATQMPRFLLPLVALAYLALGVGSNSLTALFAFAVLVSGFTLLWRPGETPILLYGFVFQWVEAS